MLVSNLSQSERFLSLLDADGIFTFQTFPEGKNAIQGPRVLHGLFERHAHHLELLNDDGAGIFVMVNIGDGVIREGSKTCRTAVNVQRIRAIFVDLDGAPIRPVLTSALRPDWVVQSSPYRWHAYWKVDECRLDEFGPAQTALAARFGGDVSVKDLPRVMRVPGFMHRKAEPIVSKLFLPTDYNDILEDRHD